MIKDTFEIKDWSVTILYECTCEDTDYIVESLMDINCPAQYIKEAVDNIDSCNLNIGLTYSNINKKSSVIVVSKTSSIPQLINTIAHEYFHLICHLQIGLNIEDEEELAKLNGDLNMKSFSFLQINFEKVGLD